MAYFLIDNPPRRSQFRTSRRAKPTGCIVVHTAENAPDIVPPDTGAESVAKFIQNRGEAGSYHRIADSDSIVPIVPFSYEAYHDGTGSNSWSIGISAATKAAQWNSMSAEWRDKTISNLAQAACEAALWLHQNYGILVPARRITKAESDLGLPGFISHGERDPSRRSDPGRDFPWNSFLNHYVQFCTDRGLTVSHGSTAIAESPGFVGILNPGQYLKSGDLNHLLIHQPDGNVVLYRNQNPAWSTKTAGKKTSVFAMQGDGNLVLYGEDKVIWASGTDGNPNSVLRVQNDGNLVIYAPGGIPIWDIAGSKPRPILREGAKGSHVRYLQERLRAHGFQIAADSAFGPATKRAVIHFQGARSLVQDGIVGPATWGALG